MDHNSIDQLPYGLRCELLDAFGTWVTDYMDQGHDAYLTTFMFNYTPGNSKSIIGSMTKDIEQFYRTLVTRIVRKMRAKRKFTSYQSSSHYLTDLCPSISSRRWRMWRSMMDCISTDLL